MKNRLFVLILAALPAFASASSGTAALGYTRATTNVDGSALAQSDITGHTIACVFTPTGATVAAPCASLAGSQVGNVAAASVTFTYPATGGKACFTVSTTTAAGTGPASAQTEAACKVFAAILPSPPSNVTVTVTVSVNLPAVTAAK